MIETFVDQTGRRTRGQAGRAVGVVACVLMFAIEAPAVVSIDVGSAIGVPGDEVTVAVTVATTGEQVSGTQNLIAFEPAAAIAARPNGQPDCAVNPAINKLATGFRFQPQGCERAGACTAVRAFVLAFDNLDPIPDGEVLYTCQVLISEDAAPGVYPLTNGEVGASGVNAELLDTVGTGGQIEVEVAQLVSIDVGSAVATAGETAMFAVTLDVLRAAGSDVIGTRNEIVFDRWTPIAGDAGGAPDCVVNPEIDKTATAFSFLPAGCVPAVDCERVLAVVLSFANLDPIPDGSLLYWCTVHIAPDAPSGHYALVSSGTSASDSSGRELSTVGSDGFIEVVDVCVGDCDGDGDVSISELLQGVALLLADASPDQCRAFDPNGDGIVWVGELITGVNNALNGCRPGHARDDPARLVDSLP